MLPTIEPTNCWTKAEHSIAQLLASLSTVQAFLNVGNTSEAQSGNMYVDAFPPPADGEQYTAAEWLAFFPAVLLGTPGDDASAFMLDFIAAPNSWNAQGTIEIQFQNNLDIESIKDTVPDQERQFKNHVGSILEELGDQVYDSTFFQKLAVIEYGRTSNKSEFELGPVQIAIVELTWGLSDSGE